RAYKPLPQSGCPRAGADSGAFRRSNQTGARPQGGLKDGMQVADSERLAANSKFQTNSPLVCDRARHIVVGRDRWAAPDRVISVGRKDPFRRALGPQVLAASSVSVSL